MASAIYRAIKEYVIEQEENKVVSMIEQVNKNEHLKVNDKNDLIDELPIYKVQSTAIQKKNLSDIEGNPISFFQERNLYKFTIGNEKSIEAAKNLQALAKKNGYNDAFVIAFYKEQKISLQKAKELTQENDKKQF